MLSPPIAPSRQECSSLPSDYCQWPDGCRRRSVSVALLQQLLFLCSPPDLPTAGAGSCHPLHSTEHYMHVLVLHRRREKDDRRGGCAAAAKQRQLLFLYGVLYCTSILTRRGKALSSFLLLLFSRFFYYVRLISPLGKDVINYDIHSESMQVTASFPIYRTD